MRPQINLIDPSLLPKVERLSPKTVGLITVLALALLGVHYGYERTQLNKTLAAAKAQDDAIAALAPVDPAQIDAAFEARKRSVMRDESLRDGLSKLTDLPKDNAKMLSSVIAALPNSLWLKEVDFVAKDGIRIVGGATDPSALAAYSDALARVPALRGLPIEVVTLEAPVGSNDQDAATATHQHYHFVLATAKAQGGTP